MPRLIVTVPDEVRQRLFRVARREGLSVNELVVDALRELLEVWTPTPRNREREREYTNRANPAAGRVH